MVRNVVANMRKIFQNFIKRNRVSIEYNSRDVLGKEEEGSLSSKQPYVLKKQLATLIFYPAEFSGFAPALAGRTADHPITIWNIAWLDVRDTASL